MMNLSGWMPKSNNDREKRSKVVRVPQKFKVDCDYPHGPSGVKPVRIILLLVTLVLFAFVVYMTAMDSSPLTDASSILLIILTSIYVFVLAMDLISQFGGAGITDSPVQQKKILNSKNHKTHPSPSLDAGVQYTGCPAIRHGRTRNNILLVRTQWLLGIAGIVSTLPTDRYFIYARAVPDTRVRITEKNFQKFFPNPLPQKHRAVTGDENAIQQRSVILASPPTPASQISKYDATTSVSSCRQAPVIEDTMDPVDMSHAYRKIEKVHRRQYVDTQSSVPSVAIVDIAQVQTEQRTYMNTEIQTEDIESSTCTCNIKPCTPIYSPCLRPATCAACNGYPIMHLMHSDLPMSASYYSDCKCSGTMEVHREDMQRQEDPVRENAATSVSHTSPCPTHGSGLAATLAGLPLAVTRVTLPDCYVRRNKRTQTPKQSVSSDKENKTVSVDESSKRQKIEKDNAEVAEEKLDTEEKREEGVLEKEQQLPAEKTVEEKSPGRENRRDSESGTM
ncbi:uncharacterized protein LOC107271474 isoform X1 [Cephus cinctus]|uniref:Uncharacterized protein LOC107271474 isoform X1 n=1 Tax=Cephus cinctus TaxID=211228 RepID=A0AAJ7RQA9_CEPCN|nr:uncharacterized protein LOC107271474 isoform X1 [Cephus cinctus]